MILYEIIYIYIFCFKLKSNIFFIFEKWTTEILYCRILIQAILFQISDRI